MHNREAANRKRVRNVASFRRAAAAVFAFMTACAFSSTGHAAPQPTTAYVNGHWYDGSAFSERTVHVRAGVFVDKPGEGVTRTVDLEGAYVLPAFGEGHHHTVLCDPKRISQFISAGILYAAIMNARTSSRECQKRLHGDGSVEVVNALAGITATNAHPSQIGRYFLPADQIDGEWVHFVDSETDLDRVWWRIEKNRPDFLKIFLSYSEDFEKLRSDETIQPWYRGLDPHLVAPIVKRAHNSGLRVAAHVMSAHDFEVALNAGVDIIAHMPGFAPGAAFTNEPDHPYLSKLKPDSPRYYLDQKTVRRAAARGIAVVTTLSGGGKTGPAAAANVAALRAAGVTLLIGSDSGEGNSVDEAVFLVENGLLPPSEAVHSLSVTTPRFFFRGRSIGELKPGAEATFVVLKGNPIEDIHNLRKVTTVVQRGRTLHPARAGAQKRGDGETAHEP